MIAISALLLSFAPGIQEPDATPPLPPGVVARFGDREVTLEDYKDYLWRRFQKRPLREMVSDLLLEEEAERYGVQAEEQQIGMMVAQREEAARRSGRPGRFEADLFQNGQTLEMYRGQLATEARRDLLMTGLVRATRVVTDPKLKLEFERQFGPDGQRMALRHILIMPNMLRAERVRGGTPASEIDMEAIWLEAEQMAAEARRRIEGGEDFTAVCTAVSHDQNSRNRGGSIPQYNGRIYGADFKTAVSGLEPGQLSGLVRTGAGYHVVELVSKVSTNLEDVRGALVDQMLAAEPNWQEKSLLLQTLVAATKVQYR